ncbi:MAG: hypothetical protein EOP10_04440 [Proteobacteria bacterium]|nr:MAG: hypothetical protein EOP10_04440 [Pseudomonadota bacterium]
MMDGNPKVDLSQPLKLSANLFTPLMRTPWGGKDIAKRYKQSFVEHPENTIIGESWEVSCDPSFPSLVLGTSLKLSELIAAEPEKMLSRAYVKAFGANFDILVKLVNAAQPLSLQVHPSDDNPSLKPGECGKPESWLVLHAEPGSGLYLGFSKSITKTELQTLLESQGDLKPYLQFVPVKEGDYFEISPGVIHAIGPGVTLLEPQRVRIGKAGKTYRFWDWSRRYNQDGSLNNVSGQERELHVTEGLKIIDPEKQVGAAYVASLRARAEVLELSPKVKHSFYPANANYQVHRLQMQAGSQVQLSAKSGFLSFVCLGGSAVMGMNLAVSRGEPGFIPFDALPLLIDVDKNSQNDFDITLIIPPSCDLKILAVS